ncbi:DUF4097 family beta strand repeat-containing protein [Nocardioides sp. CER19]|uniref:DUF4097 family beta strand repeat-containing protein n=1 Tax=Nocardioides sp. CER19 TaxID=3038538 RepID=UPI00244A896B|nr:DUF4097 family beta strand repeat-containing protein [Nocardioides sp. CER19]MDH2412626.1 DUF4097 family beta strand repeat-containing protein [Nocardioides sp. CER19]
MPTFSTPEPITAIIEPVVGDVTIVASDRVDTVVEVRPADPDNESDVEAAARTTVGFTNGTLTVKAPRAKPLSWSNKTRAIAVAVALPAGSHLEGSTAMGDLQVTGRLGDVTYKTSAGDIHLDETAALSVSTSAGNVRGDRVTGKATVSISSGRLQLGELVVGGVLKNSNGAAVVGAAHGPLEVRVANGDITVEGATDDVDAKSAMGTVRVLDAAHGTLTLETAMSGIEVGVHEGTAAWLDVSTKFGKVRNELTASGAPGESADKVEIHASTSFGDVTVRRA